MAKDNNDEAASPDASAPDSESASKKEPTPLGDNQGVYIPQDVADELPVDFGGFVVSLGTSCMVNLGRVPNPETHQVDKDLGAAKHTIEILKMLKQKTKGNLESGEEKLLDSLLYDVRMAYVAESSDED